tara:strand:+ start:1443 stop:2237 length:795 start_codon:yes stop_codon:yes gene_type:complete
MPNYDLKNKTALITGASKGIGLGIAKSLAQEGVNLLLISRTKKDLLSCSKEILSKSKIKIEILPGDVKNKDLPLKAYKIIKQKFGTCDILVNNSGGPEIGSFLDHSEKKWNEAYNQNLYSIVNFSKKFVPDMKKKKWGRVINITSSLAKEPTPQMVLSASMRAGVSAFSKSISTELAPYGITVNTVCPGGVLTKRLEELVKISAKKEKIDFETMLQKNVESIPIGRFASTEEFADVVTFLISDKGKYLTGLSLMADGGLTKGIF